MQDYLGSYRLLTQIRAGKTCQIWEAMHDSKQQKFALKVLPAEFVHDREQVQLLKHEFAVGQALRHPRVIQSHELGIDRETYYLAMELCAAPNLKQAIQGGTESLYPHVTSIITQAGEGLAYFHSRGWVHRDIKPDNFLLTGGGDIKLIDFALAQRIRRGLMRLLPSRAGKIQGTRSYMSPEQIRGGRLDHRADIYSFGCMLYELLSGRPPFTGNSTNELLTKHLKAAPPSLQGANRLVSDPFAHMVKKMMSKEPKKRPNSMNEFLDQFRCLAVFKDEPGRK